MERRSGDRRDAGNGLDTVTTSVTITILATNRYGKDGDTIISEALCWGYAL